MSLLLGRGRINSPVLIFRKQSTTRRATILPKWTGSPHPAILAQIRVPQACPERSRRVPSFGIWVSHPRDKRKVEA
jgi:hypothetical protein